MSLLIRNGHVVTATETRCVDVFCEHEQIRQIGEGLQAPPGTRVIDATGKYVFPGFIDPHAHVYLPLKTVVSKDTYETASRAALLGGTTFFIDFCSPERNQDPMDALYLWDVKSRRRSACDYSYHMAVTRFDKRCASQLHAIVAQGITSFKIYLAYKDSVNLPDDEIEPLLRVAREWGVLTMAHCENAEKIALAQQRLLKEGKTGPEWHYWSRPPEIEAEGTAHFLSLTEKAGVPAYVVHVSCAEAFEAAIAARNRGAKVWMETLTSYLLLDRTYAEQPGFEGAKYVVSPPLRDLKNQDVLWRAVQDGIIDTVATDHAPFDFRGQKTLGRSDFTKIPSGMPTLQDRINLLYTYGVCAGKLSLNRMVDVASTKPARLFGLYPRKGTLEVGSDADLVVYDPVFPGTISAATHAMNVDYNPFEGWPINGRPELVTVRGRVVVDGGIFVGESGWGRFVPRAAGTAVA